MKSIVLALLTPTLLISCVEQEPEQTSAEELVEKFDAFAQSSKDLIGAANDLLGDNLQDFSVDMSQLEEQLRNLSGEGKEQTLDKFNDLKTQLGQLQQQLNKLDLNSSELGSSTHSEQAREQLSQTYQELKDLFEELAQDTK